MVLRAQRQSNTARALARATRQRRVARCQAGRVRKSPRCRKTPESNVRERERELKREGFDQTSEATETSIPPGILQEPPLQGSPCVSRFAGGFTAGGFTYPKPDLQGLIWQG